MLKANLECFKYAPSPSFSSYKNKMHFGFSKWGWNQGRDTAGASGQRGAERRVIWCCSSAAWNPSYRLVFWGLGLLTCPWPQHKSTWCRGGSKVNDTENHPLRKKARWCLHAIAKRNRRQSKLRISTWSKGLEYSSTRCPQGRDPSLKIK